MRNNNHNINGDANWGGGSGGESSWLLFLAEEGGEDHCGQAVNLESSALQTATFLFINIIWGRGSCGHTVLNTMRIDVRQINHQGHSNTFLKKKFKKSILHAFESSWWMKCVHGDRTGPRYFVV